jgi:RNA polymerase sigma factor (sigma-70 family)
MTQALEVAPAALRTDQEALDNLSRRFRSALCRYFEKRGFHGADAEDAVQDVFIRLSQRAGVARIDNIDGYLFETAASVVVDHFRRATVRHRGEHDEYDEAVHAPAAPSIEREHIARDELAQMVTALRELPERTRNALLLARLEGLSHGEIAHRLGISASAVEKHIVKALAHLGRRLGRTPR